MKKVISLMFMALTVVVLSGCGSSGGSTPSSPVPSPSQPDEPHFPAGEYGKIDLNTDPNWQVPDGAIFLDIRNDWERVQIRAKSSVGGAVYEFRDENGGSRTLNPDFVDDVRALVDGNENKQVILICHSGSRSASASQLLANNGFTNVWDMLGGMNRWSTVKPAETIYNTPL